MTNKIIYLLFIMILTSNGYGQCDNPPNGESCKCNTAPVLCEQGLYVYKITYQSRFKIDVLSGDVTVIR